MRSPTMKESSRKERCVKFRYTAKKAVAFEMWVKHPTPRSRWKRFGRNQWEIFAEGTLNRCLVCTCLQIAFLVSTLISCHFSNVCMSVVQAGFLLP